MNDHEALQTLCRQIRERSRENREAIALLHGADLQGQVVSILRQELDSMIRVIFLLSLNDSNRRLSLIRDAVDGRVWRIPSKGRITDREMVEIAQRLHGWTGSVYRFGCAFIHLSNLHDYRDRDPLNEISPGERDDLLRHLRHYHGGPDTASATFRDVVRFLPSVFEKVAGNLECYVKQLETAEQLSEWNG